MNRRRRRALEPVPPLPPPPRVPPRSTTAGDEVSLARVPRRRWCAGAGSSRPARSLALVGRRRLRAPRDARRTAPTRWCRWRTRRPARGRSRRPLGALQRGLAGRDRDRDPPLPRAGRRGRWTSWGSTSRRGRAGSRSSAARSRGATSGEGPPRRLLGLGAFGWGGERITRRAAGGPGRARRRAAHARRPREGGRFAVAARTGVLLHGAVGRGRRRRRRELFVSELVARPGTEFRIVHYPRAQVVADLQQDLRISEKGKKTGVLQLALEGDGPRPDRRHPRRALARLPPPERGAEERRGGRRRSSSSTRSSPSCEAKLEKAERELEGYRRQGQHRRDAWRRRPRSTRAVDIEKAVSELQVEYAALRQRFTESHPALVRARAQKLAAARGRARRARGRMQEAARGRARVGPAAARREGRERAVPHCSSTGPRSCKVVKEGTVGNVRILDAAMVPVEPVVAAQGRGRWRSSLLLGLALGVGLAFVRTRCSTGRRGPGADRARHRHRRARDHPAQPRRRRRARARREKSGERVPLLADDGPEGPRGGEPAEPPHQPPVRAARGAEQRRHA